MKLSIITINYNNRDGLRKTIESVVNQTWKDFEYIIIDGGSTDDSVEVIKEFADRIDYWVSEPDKGIYNAMNKGIGQAKGEYCLFLNSGDSLHRPHTLTEIAPLLNECDIISGSLNKLTSPPVLMIPPHVVSLAYLYEGTLPHQSTFIRTNILQQLYYDEHYRMVSDWKFWVEALVLHGYTYKCINQVVSDFDMAGISSTHTLLRIQERTSVLHELLPERIKIDYERFINGEAWDEKLLKQITHTKFRGPLYSCNVLLLKLIALFRKKARWIWEYPSSLS